MSGRPSTKKHYIVLDAIREFINEHGYSPTIDELSAATGITSKAVVYYYMQKLKAEKLIRWERNKRRTIQLVGTAPFMRIPAQAHASASAPKPKRVHKPQMSRLTGDERKTYQEKCFDRAVELGLKRNESAGGDALHDTHSFFPNGKFRCVKVG